MFCSELCPALFKFKLTRMLLRQKSAFQQKFSRSKFNLDLCLYFYGLGDAITNKQKIFFGGSRLDVT